MFYGSQKLFRNEKNVNLWIQLSSYFYWNTEGFLIFNIFFYELIYFFSWMKLDRNYILLYLKLIDIGKNLDSIFMLKWVHTDNLSLKSFEIYNE